MNLDKLLVRKALEGGPKAYLQAKQSGIISTLLYGDGRQAWEWVDQYERKHGVLPTPELVEVNLGIVLDDDKGAALDFLSDEVIKRGLYNLLKDSMEKIATRMEQRDPVGAADEMRMAMEAAREVGLSQAKVRSLWEMGEEVIEQYLLVKSGKTGLLTPWPTANDLTNGLWEKMLIGVVARAGVGKTFFASLIARYGWVMGAKCLIATTEMSQLEMAFRMHAIHHRLPFEPFLRGKLGEFVEKAVIPKIREMMTDRNMLIVGDDFDFFVEDLTDAIKEHKPRLVLCDGAYLMRHRKKKSQKDDRSSRVAEVMDDLKRIAKRNNLIVMFTSQLNKEAKKGDKASTSDAAVGITDAINFNSDILWGLVQDEDMRSDKRMDIVSMKVRNGRPRDFSLRWDMESMDFSELGREAEAIPDGERPNIHQALASAAPADPENEETF